MWLNLEGVEATGGLATDHLHPLLQCKLQGISHGETAESVWNLICTKHCPLLVSSKVWAKVCVAQQLALPSGDLRVRSATKGLRPHL